MTYYKKGGKGEKSYVEAMPFHGVDVEVLIMCAVRYAHGRMSYSPSCVMNFCKENWAQLTEKTRKNIMRDTLEWLGDRHLYPVDDTNYQKEWTIFLQWCFSQNAEEAAWCRYACVWIKGRMQGVDSFFEMN